MDTFLRANYIFAKYHAGDTMPRFTPLNSTPVNLGTGRTAVDMILPSDIAACVLMDNSMVRAAPSSIRDR